MDTAIAKTAPGRPKDLEKRAAILAAGKRLFPLHGFDGTSMDAIAAEAGVSKLTVYSHFKDKDTLFQQVVTAHCEEQLPHAIFEIDRKAPLRRQLTEIAHAFFRLIVSPEAIAVHKMMSAQQSPKLAMLFWEAGPKPTQEELEAFLRAEIAEGVLDIPDTHRAASQFFCLLKGEPHYRIIMGCCECFTQAEIDAHIKATVDFFLRAYAVRR